MVKQPAQLKLIHSLLSFTTRIQLQVEEELRKHELTITQFQILSVLAEAYPEKLALIDVRKRMTRRTSDFTRIIDRLIDKGLVHRFDCKSDRRRTELEITASGMHNLDKISTALLPVGKGLQDFLKENSINISEELLESINENRFDV